MSTYRIERHEKRGTHTDPVQATIDAGRVWEAADVANLGHSDFAYTGAELAAYAAEDSLEQMVFFMAYDGDRCVGFLRADAPRHDNVHHIHAELRTVPGTDPCSVLNAARPVLLDLCSEQARTSMPLWEPSRMCRPTIDVACGEGAVEGTAVTAWLMGKGSSWTRSKSPRRSSFPPTSQIGRTTGTLASSSKEATNCARGPGRPRRNSSTGWRGCVRG